LGFAKRAQKADVSKGENHLNIVILKIASKLEVVFVSGWGLIISCSTQNTNIPLCAQSKSLRDAIFCKCCCIPARLYFVCIAKKLGSPGSKTQRPLLGAAIYKIGCYCVLARIFFLFSFTCRPFFQGCFVIVCTRLLFVVWLRYSTCCQT